VPNAEVVANIQIYLHAKFHIFLNHSSIFLFCSLLLIYLIGKRIEIGKFTVGRFSPRPAQLGSASAQLSRQSQPAPSVSVGRCKVGPTPHGPHLSASLLCRWKTTMHPTDLLPRPLRSNPSPSSASANSHHRRNSGQICDASVRPRLPHAAPSHPLAVGR
jgi:hypothetical protein